MTRNMLEVVDETKSLPLLAILNISSLYFQRIQLASPQDLRVWHSLSAEICNFERCSCAFFVHQYPSESAKHSFDHAINPGRQPRAMPGMLSHDEPREMINRITYRMPFSKRDAIFLFEFCSVCQNIRDGAKNVKNVCPKLWVVFDPLLEFCAFPLV